MLSHCSFVVKFLWCKWCQISDDDDDRNGDGGNLAWRGLCGLLDRLQEEEHIVITPYEKNLEFWRQLWRVIERRWTGCCFVSTLYRPPVRNLLPWKVGSLPLPGGTNSCYRVRIKLFCCQWICLRAQELHESRGGGPGLPVPNSPYSLCGCKITFSLRLCVLDRVSVWV